MKIQVSDNCLTPGLVATQLLYHSFLSQQLAGMAGC